MPGDVIAVAYYTLKEMTRRKLPYFIVGGGAVVILALGILAAVIRANAPGGSVPTEDFSGFVLIQMYAVVSFFAWVASIAIAVTLINHDLESGSAVSIFSKPVSRLLRPGQDAGRRAAAASDGRRAGDGDPGRHPHPGTRT